MSEEEVKPGDGAELDDADDDVSLLGAPVTVGADGKRSVSIPLDTIIGLRKENRTSKQRLREIEPVAARVKDVDQKLADAMPIVNAILNDPKLKAAALRGAHGTQAQDIAEQVDADAKEHAEDHGWYLSDGITPDVAKGQRDLARISSRSRAQAEDVVRPMAGMVLNSRGQANLNHVLSQTDDDGLPMATRESIMQAAKMVGPELMANPEVSDIILTNAMGLDRRFKRTPKAVDDPPFLESQGGRRRGSEISIDAGERSRLSKLGLTEEDYKKAEKSLAASGGRRGVVLGQ